MFRAEADLFFEHPRSNRPPPETYGVLHLLRKDILICLGIDPRSGGQTSHKALWPGAMAMLAGVDLLAKFWTGDDRGSSGHRFKDFVREYFVPIENKDVETIYQLRNALLHSFGLYSKAPDGTEYRFCLTARGGESLVQRLPADVCRIDLVALYLRFELAIAKYAEEVEKQELLQTRFLNMFPKYGSIQIG